MSRLDNFYLLLAFMVCCLFGGCQTLMEEEETLLDGGTLKVKARSAEDVEIVYPVYLYVFSESGECVESQLIEEEKGKMEFQLTAGAYRIVAVSGVSDDYELPQNPDLDDVIRLDAVNGADSPLMVGKADVTIGSESKATLEIALTYVVTAVNVSLFNVPSETKKVSFVLSPFYTSLSMGGEYGGEKHALEMDCSLDAENVWRSDTRYVFPGSSSETVFSVILEAEDGVETAYGYTWGGTLDSNRPFFINGNYAGGITVSGNLIVKGWETATEVNFEFASNDQTNNENENEKPEVDLSVLPETGEIWNGAIVADVGEPDDSGEVEMLLLSLDEWEAKTSQIPDIVDGYQVNGLSGWRLPDFEEAKMFRERYNKGVLQELNERIKEYDSKLYVIDDKERYLCNKYGAYYTFIFADGTSITEAGAKRTYYVRLVKSYSVNIDSDLED